MSIPYPPGEALTCDQIRELDVLAIEHAGVAGLVLMENAGRGVAEFVYDALLDPARARVVILCGPGNNGGDGFVAARHLLNAGVSVEVVLAASPDKSRGDAGTNLRILERMDIQCRRMDEPADVEAVRAAITTANLIVDALLGTGSRGAPRGPAADLVTWANTAPRARRIAVDIPSGLDGDSGKAHDPCFRADATVTMVAPKVGFEQGEGPAVVGRVVTVDIGLPRSLVPGRPENRVRGVDS